MKLYYAPGACSLSPHIVAREGNLPVEMVKVLFAGGRTTETGENFYDINPMGYVPTLRLDNGEVLTEGVAIVQYLADQAPSANLVPQKGSMPYYRTLEWLTFISSELHKGFSPLFRSGISEAEKASVVERLAKRYDRLEKALSTGAYLLGDIFTVADAYCYTILRWTPRAGIDLSKYPNLSAYMKRIETRSSVQVALKEEGLV